MYILHPVHKGFLSFSRLPEPIGGKKWRSVGFSFLEVSSVQRTDAVHMDGVMNPINHHPGMTRPVSVNRPGDEGSHPAMIMVSFQCTSSRLRVSSSSRLSRFHVICSKTIIHYEFGGFFDTVKVDCTRTYICTALTCPPYSRTPYSGSTVRSEISPSALAVGPNGNARSDAV